MKKLHYLVLSGFMLLFGCHKDNKTCDVPSFELKTADKKIEINLYSEYENGLDIEYGPAGFAQGSGTSVTLANSVTFFTVTDYASYDVFLRKKCLNGGVSEWSGRNTVNVDGGTTGCLQPYGLSAYSGFPQYFEWDGQGDFYDIEYGPTGFTIGNGIRSRTNVERYTNPILTAGTTYDFYVRSNCGGNTFSSWTGPKSVYVQVDQNTNLPCTEPSNLYAYKINSYEINYTASGGQSNYSYEIAFSTSGSSNTGNILSSNSPNGTVGFNGSISGTTYYFWIRGRCSNGSFTNWVVSQVQ